MDQQDTPSQLLSALAGADPALPDWDKRSGYGSADHAPAQIMLVFPDRKV